jgi:hypothetical protein
MPAAQWPLQNDRPVIDIVLSASGGQDLVRSLVADTGAGTRQSVFQLILTPGFGIGRSIGRTCPTCDARLRATLTNSTWSVRW